ncbi:LysE family translocator [Formosa algae]|uniref:Threonine/homoserine/homoserine lactone efflux protein n=1 Tax=Formosa algae TaxID=225843 RepID=A0A9X0YIW1_9FLAO|nr:LysE family transporter [Formosa algae]MBP1839291.1 threonine/homoserine/homoserine lactone efflux protein [Formosa algae]MDQ0334068.1 threonine/homoserine/homoserine lactone efflux protein [Formosa algae]OEI79395.1 lysine transporter LysE [Formosa algae]
MNITLIFFLGFIVSLVGVIPPGLLNMTAAKISLKEGFTRGIMFSIGACIIVLIQTLIAVIFARYLTKHPDVVNVLQRVALVIFILISLYFFFIAKGDGDVSDEKIPEVRSKKSRFFQGMLMSALNMFPIPFQAYMSVTLASFGWLTFEHTDIFAYVFGSAMGSFVMLYMYMVFFDKIESTSFKSQKNMNRFIGGITAIVALVTLIHVIKDF